MFNKIFFFLLILTSKALFAQSLDTEFVVKKDTIQKLDLKYREDQFYFGVTHSILQEKPSKFSPRSFSLGLQGGFLRDFPINKKRTISIAPGIGYSYFNLQNNLTYNKDNSGFIILDTYTRNSQNMHYVDFPLELRWRTSTPGSHKFWRVYVGFKASYLFYDNAKTSSDNIGSYSVSNNTNFNKWTFSTYISTGFNTWNVYASYGLNTIYKNDVFKDNSERLRYFNVGLIFYIL